ncbi:replicative DNA helicase [Photobacterium frigidiphilum]|uniref:replicative DNA helicase n=1 Tax=Photobacterium frigidiphilum TaxID=264736 RepID=UPI003D0E4989
MDINYQSQANAAEQSVLGALFLIGDPKAPAVSKIFYSLKMGSFSEVMHRDIYRAINNVAQTGSRIDLITVEAELRNLLGIGSNQIDFHLSYLVDLVNNTPSSRNVMAYVSIVKNAAVERETLSLLESGLALMSDPSEGDPIERLGLVISSLERARSSAVGFNASGLSHMSDIGKEWLEGVEARFNGEAALGLKTGLNNLDKILAPKSILPGSLVAIGARPKMGKTAFTLKIAEYVAIEEGKGIATFSLEMPKEQIYERMVSSRARIDSGLFYQNPEDVYNFDTEFAKASLAISEYNNTKCYIDDSPSVTITYIEAESRRLHREVPLAAIMVDYLTLMTTEKAERNDLAYGDITKRLKQLAKELNCVVFLVTQLNRKLEERADKRPLPFDSRDTGQIEQDCDIWIGLYRDSVYHADSPNPPELMEAIVRYNRHGGTGTAYLELINGYVGDFLSNVVFDNPSTRKTMSAKYARK